jgi:hypothetical protein
MEIEEVVRRWQVNESQRAIARAAGWSPNAVTKRDAAGGTPLTLKVIEGIDDLAQQMEAIGDLDCGGRAEAHSLRGSDDRGHAP